MCAAFLLALLLAAPVATSQPPSPGEGRQRAEQQQPATNQQEQAAVNQSVSQPSIPAPNPSVTPLNQITIQQTHDDEQDTSSSGLRDWVIGLLTVGVAGLQWWVMNRQRQVSSEQATITQKQNDIIETQTAHMESGVDVAKDSAAAAKTATQIAADALATNREIERAYISFGHSNVVIDYEPDGQGGQDSSKPTSVSVRIHIRNDGRTPGDFIGGYFGFNIGPKPTIPDLTRGISNLAPVFLLPNKDTWFGWEMKESPGTWRDIWAGRELLWLTGEADYIDRFGHLHTAGYGRWFDPNQRFFVFRPETGPWNFDRPMHPDKVRHYDVRDGQAYSQRHPAQ